MKLPIMTRISSLDAHLERRASLDYDYDYNKIVFVFDLFYFVKVVI